MLKFYLMLATQTMKKWTKAYVTALAAWVTLAMLSASQIFMNASEYANRPSYLAVLKLPLLRAISFAILTVPLFFIVQKWPVKRGKIGRRVVIYAVSFGV